LKSATAAALVLAASPALAHPGHVALLGGHTHWAAAAAVVAALLVAIVWAGGRLAKRMRRRRA